MIEVDGACHCGQITFKAEIDPDSIRICHCNDCQRLSGSAFRVSAPTAEANFHLLSGSPKIYLKTAESGAKRAQAFCGDCGTQLYATSPDGDDRIFGLRVGTLEQRAGLTPKQQLWCRSKLRWLPTLPGETLDRQ